MTVTYMYVYLYGKLQDIHFFSNSSIMNYEYIFFFFWKTVGGWFLNMQMRNPFCINYSGIAYIYAQLQFGPEFLMHLVLSHAGYYLLTLKTVRL